MYAKLEHQGASGRPSAAREILDFGHGNLCKLYRYQKCLECKVFGLPPTRGTHAVMPCAPQPCAAPVEAVEVPFHHVKDDRHVVQMR